MKKINLFICVLLLLITSNINVYACSVEDKCTNCKISAEKSACDSNLRDYERTHGITNSTPNTSINTDCKDACGPNGNANACQLCENAHGGTYSGTAGQQTTGGNSGGANTTDQLNQECLACYQTYFDDEKNGYKNLDECLVSHSCPTSNKSENNNVQGNASVGTGLVENSEGLKQITGCEAIFGIYENGKFIDVNSLGYFLQMIFNIVKYAVPIILIVLTIVDFVKATTSGDKDNVKKALQSTYKRGIIAVIIFILPTILKIILGLVTTYGTCGIK